MTCREQPWQYTSKRDEEEVGTKYESRKRTVEIFLPACEDRTLHVKSKPQQLHADWDLDEADKSLLVSLEDSGLTHVLTRAALRFNEASVPSPSTEISDMEKAALWEADSVDFGS